MDSHSLAALTQLTGSHLIGDPEYQISGVNHLETAQEQEATFCENPRYEKLLSHSKAGVIFVPPALSCLQGKNLIIHAHPSFAFQKVIELFLKTPVSGFTGIHPSAVIDSSAVIGKNVTIGPKVIIDQGVFIGDECIIDGGVYIGAETQIGKQCRIYPNVVIREKIQIGDRVVVQAGAVIGSCGFGYFTDSHGLHHPLKQLGSVVIEDDVDIGANTTIDRARLKTTQISRGTKIDNLVQIAHQVSLGEDNLIVSQVGIAGSTTTGKNVILGGQVGVIGHITLGNGVILAARSAVSKSLKEAGVYRGFPAMPIREFNEHTIHLRKFPKYIKKMLLLEEELTRIQAHFLSTQGNFFTKLSKKWLAFLRHLFR